MARPKGYANWNPKDETIALVEKVQRILSDNADYLPLTARQIFYILVGQYDYDKTEKAYSRLTEHLVRARRAQLIKFEDIRDDGTIQSAPLFFDNVGDFWDATRKRSDHYMRNRLAGQKVRVELWCEAAGMVPQLFRVAGRYSVPVYSTGGFSSVTVTKEIAMRALDADVPTVFLHVGDYDPSGESIFDAMHRDARSFLLQEVLWKVQEDGELDYSQVLESLGTPRFEEFGLPDLIPHRVALTESQVDQFNLPTAPPKLSDTRSRNWVGETCQAEALTPERMAEIVEDAIRDNLDLDLLEAEKAKEAADENEIKAVLDEQTTNGTGE